MNWIKMRADLRDDPTVRRVSKITKLDKLAVIGRLWALWVWVDAHAVHGRVDDVDASDVDEICDRKGFADALVQVHWLELGDGFIVIPKHDRHNGESAKERSLKNARQSRWRQSKGSDVDAKTSTRPSTDDDGEPSTDSSTDPSTREEKRREEKNILTDVDCGAAASAAPPTPPPPFDGTNAEVLNGKAVVCIAAGFELPDDWGFDAEALGFKPAEVLHQAEKFRQYWVAGKGAGTRRSVKGWRQTWSNWLDKAAKDQR